MSFVREEFARSETEKKKGSEIGSESGNRKENGVGVGWESGGQVVKTLGDHQTKPNDGSTVRGK